jgi:hypothetical protein
MTGIPLRFIKESFRSTTDIEKINAREPTCRAADRICISAYIAGMARGSWNGQRRCMGKIMRGYECEEGNHVVLGDDEICSANPAATQTARKDKDE